jgi:hypothetical protein
MNWFKKAQLDLHFLSHSSDGVLNILINGKKYTYYNVPYDSENHYSQYQWMINNQKIPRNKILQQLEKFSRPDIYQKREQQPTTISQPQTKPQEQHKQRLFPFMED